MFVKNNVPLCLVSLLNNLFYANTMLPNLTLAGMVYALQGFQGG
jgi:hypothetical protein